MNTEGGPAMHAQALSSSLFPSSPSQKRIYEMGTRDMRKREREREIERAGMRWANSSPFSNCTYLTQGGGIDEQKGLRCRH